MRRKMSVPAFVLGFSVVMVIASGLTSPAAHQLGVADPGSRFHNVTPYPQALPGNPSHTSFGRLMPDGTYCGVDCPREP